MARSCRELSSPVSGPVMTVARRAAVVLASLRAGSALMKQLSGHVLEDVVANSEIIVRADVYYLSIL